MAQSSNEFPTLPPGWLNTMPQEPDMTAGTLAPGAQYQTGWPADQVTLPDTSSEPDPTGQQRNASAGGGLIALLQKQADPTTLNWSPDKSSLNLLLDKHDIDDVLGGGFQNGGPGQSGGLLSGIPRPNYSVGQVDIQPLPLPDRLETDRALLQEPHVKALMATVMAHEGRQYNKLTGGGTFDDYSRHPNIAVGDSHAAGGYQLQPGTWDPIQKDLKLPDFSPTSQDLAAVDILHRRGATDRLLAGDLDGAIIAGSPVWMGLPAGPETMIDTRGRVRGIDASKKHAPTSTLEQVRADYWKNLR